MVLVVDNIASVVANNLGSRNFLIDNINLHNNSFGQNNNMKPPTQKDVLNAAAMQGISEEFAMWFFNQYDSQGWKRGNGVEITNWRTLLTLLWRDPYEMKKRKEGMVKLYPIQGHICSRDDCKMPAVYKDGSGAYDYWYCAEHMPEKVKEKYYG